MKTALVVELPKEDMERQTRPDAGENVVGFAVEQYVWQRMLKGRAADLVKLPTAALDKFSEGFGGYLAALGLPVEGVLVAPSERAKVIAQTPDLVDLMDPESRSGAMYVSKFIAACAAGLFDAALNFVWDEVVVRLRERVARFDLAYFYDTAVPAPPVPT